MILLPLLLLHLLLLFFTRFTLWPEMVVYPYLLNSGFLLYRDIINPYPPLFPYLLALFSSLFGYQPLPYQILTWFLILITDIAIFLGAAKITKSLKAALFSTLFFVVLSMPFGVNGLWFDLIQTLPVVVAVYFFARHLEKKIDNIDLLLSSVFLATAFFIKQQALWLILWFLAVLLYRERSNIKRLARSAFVLIAPLIIGLGIEVFFISRQNLLGDFLTWTVYLPFFKASQIPGYIFLPTLRQAATSILLFSIFLPLILERNSKQVFYLLTAMVLLLFAYPRFDYFHLIPSLAVLSLVFGLSIGSVKKPKALLIVPAMVLVFFFALTIRYLERNWTRQVRFFEKDVLKAANTLQKVNPKGKPIFLQNVSGQILVISQTLPTKPWADSFPWYLEIPGTQEKVLAGILNEKPDLVIYKPYGQGGKYQIASYRPQKIADFLDQNYQNVFFVDSGLWIRARMTK